MKRYQNMCLIITGTIVPNDNIYCLNLKNSEERLRQYLNSLEFYINNSQLNNIVFCDNSNTFVKKIASLEKLARKQNKNFEYLFFQGNQENILKKGKGYGEGEIIEYVLEHSNLIKRSTVLVKVTGRLIVKNINLILFLIHKNQNYFDVVKTKVCDTRFYIVSKEMYNHFFVQAYKRVDDKKNIWIEHIFKKIILDNNLSFKLFPIQPNIIGISGSTGKKYRNYSKLKYYAKLILQKIHLYKFK